MKDNFIKITEFCEKYNYKLDALYSMKSIGSIEESAFETSGRVILINESYFLRRVQFSEKVDNLTAMYYYFFNRYFTDSHISDVLVMLNKDTNKKAWNTFQNSTLFLIKNKSIVNNKIGKTKWRYFKSIRKLLRLVFKKKGINFDKVDLEKVHFIDDKKKQKTINKTKQNNFKESERVVKSVPWKSEDEYKRILNKTMQSRKRELDMIARKLQEVSM